MHNFGIPIQPVDPAADPRPVTVAVWAEGTTAFSHHADGFAAECGRVRAAMVVSLSFMGTLKPGAERSR